jgi:hypothetical protein
MRASNGKVTKVKRNEAKQSESFDNDVFFDIEAK